MTPPSFTDDSNFLMWVCTLTQAVHEEEKRYMMWSGYSHGCGLDTVMGVV